MKKTFLIIFIMFLNLTNASFACGAKGTTTFSTSIGQKACQTVFSFINLDFSVLSPRASIADLSVNGPKTNCCPQVPCCPQKQSMEADDIQKAVIPTTNDLKSMGIEEGTGRIILVTNKQEAIASEDKEKSITPVTNKQELNTTPENQQAKASLFRIDLLRRFKLQIL